MASQVGDEGKERATGASREKEAPVVGMRQCKSVKHPTPAVPTTVLALVPGITVDDEAVARLLFLV